jgi:hypothetical protein
MQFVRASVSRIGSLLLLVVVGLYAAIEVQGCSCDLLANGTVETAFRKTPTVAVFRVLSVQNHSGNEEGGSVDQAKSAVLSVDRVYKGKLATGDRFTFSNEGICVFAFDKGDIGKEFLLYLGDRPRDSEMWSAGQCTRSGSILSRAADILYLDKRGDVVGKTRLSGSVNLRTQNEGNPAEWYYKSLPDISLRIRGMGRDLLIKTNQNGVFEVYGLAPGTYEILPPKIDGYSHLLGTDGEWIKVKIENGEHTERSFFYEIDNSITGTLLDSSGSPMSNVCELDLVPTKYALPSYNRKSTCTDTDGNFSFSKILPGEYFLVGNKENNITSRAPFRTFYFPSTEKVEQATRFSVGPGSNYKDLTVIAPPFEDAITINGQVLFSDGKPWANGSVWFYTGITKASERARFQDSDSLTTTDESGKFTIRILKGYKGILSGSFVADRREYANCPKIFELIEAKRYSLSWANIETIPFEIDTSHEPAEVTLKFPFPSCDKIRRR